METKDNYRDILPTHGIKASNYQIQKFFDCVAATMSRQLRQIVFKSLDHFMNKILEYKVKITILIIKNYVDIFMYFTLYFILCS